MENSSLPVNSELKPNARLEFQHVRKWLDSDGRIIIDNDVLNRESRTGEQVEVNRSDLDLAI